MWRACAFDWCNKLKPKVPPGYQNIGQVEGQPRIKRDPFEFESWSGLSKALQNFRDARMKSKIVLEKSNLAAIGVGTWEDASILVQLWALRNNLRVKGYYQRWCTHLMKRNQGFNMDIPVCIATGVAVIQTREAVMVRVDHGLMLKRNATGRTPNLYDDKILLFGSLEHCYSAKMQRWTN